MPSENIRRGQEFGNLHIKTHSPSLSELTELFSNPKVLHYLYPKGMFIQANKFTPFPASEYYIRNVIGKGLAILSGKLESCDLGLSTLYIFPCPLGLQIHISYDGTPDSNIIKAHILKAAEFIAGSCAMRLNQRPNSDPTMFDDENRRQSSRPKIRINIFLPSVVDAHCIWLFLRETFNCDDPEEYTSTYGLFEKPYK